MECIKNGVECVRNSVRSTPGLPSQLTHPVRLGQHAVASVPLDHHISFGYWLRLPLAHDGGEEKQSLQVNVTALFLNLCD
jgi:hypothetical protein